MVPGKILRAYGYLEKTFHRFGWPLPKEFSLPDFLGIGAVKSGTTWLHRNLYRHPELFLPVKKPILYFDQYFHKSLHDYSKIFEPGRNKIKGELTASYSTLPLNRIRYIRKIMPEVKLIFILRNPIQRAWSDAKMQLTVIQRRKPEELTEEDFLREIETKINKDRGDYLGILNNWLSVFPRKQLFIGIYEEMISRRREFLQEIFGYLGVSQNVMWDEFPVDRVVFKGAVIPMPERCRKILEERHTIAEIEELSEFLKMDMVRLWNFQR